MTEYLDLNEPETSVGAAPEVEAPEATEPEAPETTGEVAAEGAENAEGEKEHKGKPGSVRQREKAQRLQQELEQTRLELEQIRRQIAPVAPKADESEPKIDDFDSLEDFVSAKADFMARKRLGEYQYQQLEQAARAQSHRQAQEWQAKMEATVGGKEDAVEAVNEFTYYAQQIERHAPETANAIASAIRESEAGPKLVVALGKDPDFMERLAHMSPFRAVAELGKLELKVLAPQDQPKPKTNAPRPPEPVRSVPAAKPKDDGPVFF